MATSIYAFSETRLAQDKHLIVSNCNLMAVKRFINNVAAVWDMTGGLFGGINELVWEWDEFTQNVIVGEPMQGIYPATSSVIAKMRNTMYEALNEQYNQCFKDTLTVSEQVQTQSALWRIVEYHIFDGRPTYEY